MSDAPAKVREAAERGKLNALIEQRAHFGRRIMQKTDDKID